MRLRVLWAVIAFWIGSGAAAVAQPSQATWEVLSSAGLSGVWAVNCHAAASLDNPYLFYHRGPTGRVTRGIVNGIPGEQALAAIEAAYLRGPHRLQIREQHVAGWGADNGHAFEMALMLTGNRMRTIRLSDGEGHVYIRNGERLADGSPSPWLEKCTP